MKKMIVKNWKRIASVLMAVILVVGSVNLSELSVVADDGNTAPNAVGGVSLNDFSLYQFLTYYQYVIKEDATIGNHTVGSMLIGGTGTIGHFGEGGIAPVYVKNLAGSGNYNERYGALKEYYEAKVPAYYGAGSTNPAKDWNEWNSATNGDFIDFDHVFGEIQTESSRIADDATVVVDYNENGFNIEGGNGAVTVVDNSYMQGKPGQLLTIDFSGFPEDGKNIRITEAAYKQLAVIDIRVNNINDFNSPHNISILGSSVNVSYAYNPVMGTRPYDNDSAVCVTINGGTFQGGALKKMAGNKEGAQLLDAPMELLWNFPEATTATVEYLGGHVVAPQAKLTIYGGNFEGGVIANSVDNKEAEGHMYPYYGIPKYYKDPPPKNPNSSEDTHEMNIEVSISIEKTFGSSEFSAMDEKVEVLDKTNFVIYNVNNGTFQEIQYIKTYDNNGNTLNNTARYKVDYSFTTEKSGTYYLYLEERTTDGTRYNICKSRWAIKVEVNDDGSHEETYVQYNEQEECYNKENVTTLAKLTYDSKNDNGPLEFFNEKIEEELPQETPEITIGLTKTYVGLDLANYTGDVEEFLDGTKFELVEVSGDAQDASTIDSPRTLTPEQNGSNAVFSNKIPITEDGIRFYRISETEASGGFKESGDVYIWKITCNDGEIRAYYMLGYNGSYTEYTEGDSYPEVINEAVSYSGTISLYKTYDGGVSVLSTMDDPQEFLNQTVFRLYGSYDNAMNNVSAIGEPAHPEWEGGRAVVKFDLGNDFTVGLNDSECFYIRETEASTGYVKSNDVYACRISNVNGIYKVEYCVGKSGNYKPDIITCNNVKQTVNIEPVADVVIYKTFNDAFNGLKPEQITRLIEDTKFTFYNSNIFSNANIANDIFVLQPIPNPNGGEVSYTYKYTGTLKPGESYTYYVKETATDETIYTMDTACYKIVITVGPLTANVETQTIPTSVTYTKVEMENGTETSVDYLSYKNTRKPKAKLPAMITFTKVFEGNFDGLEKVVINDIISATEFTLYNKPACGEADVVAGFSRVQKGEPNEKGEVVYTYSLDTSSLDADWTYTYYLKETNTDSRYYHGNDTPYVVQIEIDAQGNPTVSYENPNGLEITNRRKDPDSTELNSPTIEFTKTFDKFNSFTPGVANSIIAQTTFELVPADEESVPIDFVRVASNPNSNSNGVTYRYRLDLSGMDADTYKGGTYYIRESGTDDSRYTLNNNTTLKMEISVADGKATANIIGDRTISNALKPNDSPSTPGTPSGGGNSNPPSGGGGNNPGPNSPSGGGDNPGPNPPSGGGNNPGPNPPSDDGNDPTKQSDTDSATTSLEFSDEASAGRDTSTLSNMNSPQTGERKLPWTVLGGGMSMIFIAGTVYVFRKKEKIEE